MGALEHEIDFPRGGATAVPPHQKDSSHSSKHKFGKAGNQLFGVDKKRGTKRKEPVTAEIPAKKRKRDGKEMVWTKAVTQKLLTDGVMGLGVVTEIYADYVLLETAYSCRVKLLATQISKKFTDLLKSEKVSLDSTFVVGQMVPFRVIERSSQTIEKKRGSAGMKKASEVLPLVTCDPSKLNAHLIPLTLMPGLVLHAVVISQEEKGAVMDIGMQSMQAFLPTEKQQRPVEVGQPVIVGIDSLKTSRVVVVTSYVEQSSLCLEACESLMLNHLMPGTIIECVPDPQPSVSAGVYVTLGNGVRGFVAKSHLPPRLRCDITKVGKTLRCVVMFCQQNTPLLVLSAHPDIVAISKLEKRSSFMGYSVGDRLKCKVIDVIPSKLFVCFSLPTTEDGKVPLIAAISYKQYLRKLEKFETFYSIGSEHICRIMSVRYADRCLVVCNRKEVLNQKFVSFKDAVPGEVVVAKVTDIHPRGVQVTVSDMIKGFIPLDHVADKKVALERAFIVGANVKCRVWLVNAKKKQIWLTARPSLVNYKLTLISSYSPKYNGVVTVGVVVKILETGGAIVQFFGTVRGLLSASETKRIANEIRQGMILEVRVVSVNASEEKMMLALADESISVPSHIINPKPVNFDYNGKVVFTVIVDDVCEDESSVGGRKLERVLLHLESDKSVKGYLKPVHFSEFLDPPLESMRGLKGLKLSSVIPLGSVGGHNRFISKRFVCTWLECFKMDIPKCFANLKPFQLVCGVISQRVPDNCLYVEIAGGSGLLGKVAFDDIDGGKHGASSLQIGQTVVGRIRSIHSEKKTFRVSLKLIDCVPHEHLPSKASSPAASIALQLVRSCVEEMLQIARSSKVELPLHGTTVISTISQIADDELFVIFNDKLTGRVRKGNYTDGVKVGDKIKCLVIDYVFPQNDAELVMVEMTSTVAVTSKKIKKKSPMKENPERRANRVVLTKRDYIAVLPSEKTHLIFIPSRFHPNQVIEIKNLRVSHGDEVDIGDIIPITDQVHIGLLKKDTDLINELIPPQHLPRSFPEKKKAKLSEGEIRLAKKSKSKLGLRTKSVKNLSTYTGIVLGPWISDDRRDHGKLAAQIELPGGHIGRLHVSELPSRLLVENTFPLESFLKKYRRRSVVVKIIKFISIKKKDAKIRVAELTMNETKIAEPRKKATAVAFQTMFTHGEILRCFISPDQDLTKKKIRVEVNPLWSGQIAIEASSEDLKVEAPDRDGEVFEYLPKPGEMRLAEVLSVIKLKKSHGCGLLNLALDMQASVVKFNVGQRLTGRVIHVNLHPISVLFQLPNGQQATLCATAIANNYEKVTEHITHFRRNGIFHLYALRQDHNPQRNYVCTEGRYESYLKQKESNEYLECRRLLVDPNEVVVGLIFDGFLAKHTPEAVLVEIGPGIVGRLRKIHHPEVTSIALNSIVSVRVHRIDGQGRISLSLVKVVVQTPLVKDRKRKVDDDNSGVVVKERKEKSLTKDIEKFKLRDPGFDWSNVGFRPEDLAAVGKIGSDVANESSDQPIRSATHSSTDNVPIKAELKEERVVLKSLTKEEKDMEKERVLVSRETELSGDLNPETHEDFARLLRKDPNSAEIWIRYISFFLEKNDLRMARATAERALTVINYREETEIFNIWTAYLNMEVAYGDENSTKEIFQRSCGNADALKMHIQMAAIFSEAGKFSEADEVYEVMLKKFRANSDDIWTLYGEHLMKTDRADKARDLMKKALTSVPKQRHVPIISRFAQMEFRKGDIERGRTLFESLVSAYPKKTDLWLVYADLSLKHSGIEMARQILERACSQRLSMHKLRALFRKWMEAEERFGDDKSRLLLREKAAKFLELNLVDSEETEE